MRARRDGWYIASAVQPGRVKTPGVTMRTGYENVSGASGQRRKRFENTSILSSRASDLITQSCAFASSHGCCAGSSGARTGSNAAGRRSSITRSPQSRATLEPSVNLTITRSPHFALPRSYARPAESRYSRLSTMSVSSSASSSIRGRLLLRHVTYAGTGPVLRTLRPSDTTSGLPSFGGCAAYQAPSASSA